MCQPDDIANPDTAPCRPSLKDKGEYFIEVSRFSAHRLRDRGFQFLTLYKNASKYEAISKPMRDFLNSDGIVTHALHNYIRPNGILKHLH